MPIAGKRIREIVEENFYIKKSFVLCFPSDFEKRAEIEAAYEKMIGNNKKVSDEGFGYLTVKEEEKIMYYNEYKKGHSIEYISINHKVHKSTVYRAIKSIETLLKQLN